MNWCVFKIDDPETWPRYNCPIVVCQSVDDWPEIYQWDKVDHVFVDNYKTVKLNKCFYSYIGHLPYIERELHPTVCDCPDRHGCPYGVNYDGYCLYDKECEYKRIKTEYMVGYKRIFEEYDH